MSEASEWEVEAAVRLLSAFHGVKGSQLQLLTQVAIWEWYLHNLVKASIDLSIYHDCASNWSSRHRW